MRKTQKIAIVGGTVGILLAGGVAYAAWTSTGTGSGAVTAGQQQDLVVTGGTASGLYPTGSQTFNVTVSNENNPYKVQVDQIELDGTITVTGDGSDPAEGICDADDVTAEVVANGAGTQIAGGVGATVLNAVQLTMHGNASANCQGAIFTVPVKATAHAIN
jgi:hypothetical protein